MCDFAKDLARFLKELETVPATDGIPAGEQNFHRGGDLSVYDIEAREAIQNISLNCDRNLLTEIWESALATKHSSRPVWVHGDIAAGNLLVKNSKLCGVIDFGTMGTGDPSSDLVIAWNFMDRKSREVFFNEMGFDSHTIDRARGWCLWKALITYRWNDKSSKLGMWGKNSINAIIEEYTQSM